MGRKQKRASKQSVVPHREAFMRMNFLYQASLAALSMNPSHPELSRFYIQTMKSVSKRLVLRMDPNLKRMLCKSCDTLLVPGITSTHRIRARRERHVVVRCLTCGRVKRFVIRPDYQLWSNKHDNVVQPSNTTSEPHSATTGVPQTTSEPHSTTTGVPQTTIEPQSTTTGVPQTTIEPHSTTTGVPQTTIEPQSTTTTVPQTNIETHSTTT